ncbi:MAG: YbbR-like domain-containing protein, partial [Algoriphagus sp.]|nr:YbbR-like domain-containing protein [Algoriphagus sp.]
LLEDTIHFQIDKVITQSLTPVLDTAGYSLAKNIEIDGQVNFLPKKITLKGPSSILEAFEGKYPVQLNESKIDSRFSKKVKLTLNKNLEELIQIEQQEVEVNFEIIRYLEGNKRLKVKKINFPRSVTLENEEITPMITYLVDEKKVGELKDMEFEAVLNYSTRNRQDSTITLSVTPKPSYLKDLKIEPPLIKLKYE